VQIVVSLPKGYIPVSYMKINVARSELHNETEIYKKIEFNCAQEPFQIRFKKEENEGTRDSDVERL
jgi:hypothetical protein